MAADDQTYDEQDPLIGAVEHDGTKDGFEEASEEVDDALGLDDEADTTPREEAAYAAQDPLAGAVEHDGRRDAFAEASEEIDESLGLEDEKGTS